MESVNAESCAVIVVLNSPAASKRSEIRCQLVILVVPNDLAFFNIRKTLIPLLVSTADYKRYGQNPSPCQRSGVELKKEAVQPGNRPIRKDTRRLT